MLKAAGLLACEGGAHRNMRESGSLRMSTMTRLAVTPSELMSVITWVHSWTHCCTARGSQHAAAWGGSTLQASIWAWVMLAGLVKCRPAGSWEQAKHRAHSSIVDGRGVDVELVVQDDVEVIARQVADGVQEAGVHAVLRQVSVAGPVIVGVWRAGLRFAISLRLAMSWRD